MGWTLSIVSILVFTSAVVAFVLGLHILRYRPEPIVWPLSVLMFAVAAWSIPHAISLGYTNLNQVAFWHRLRYPGIAVAPVAYLVVALRYAGHERWLSGRTYAILGVVPLLSTIIVWTNPVHGLQWQSISLMQVNGASVVVETFGPWRPVNLAYLYLVTVAGLIVLAVRVVHSETIYRKQALTMFVGGLIPFGANVITNLEIGPDPRIDLTASALTVTGLTFALTMFHFDLLDLQPIAREKLIDELDDGVVVIGPDGLIRDFNPAAARILGQIAVEQPAEEVLPSEVVPGGGEIVVEINGKERQFQTRATPLTDDHGQQIGRVVYMNDITELVEREQRISVLNRILRHNIRNELNIVSGHLELLKDQETEDEYQYIETMRESVDRVMAFAEKAHHVERTLQRRDTGTSVAVKPVIERVSETVQETYNSADIKAEVNEDSPNILAHVVDADLFKIAIEELVENAVIHNDQEVPMVRISLDMDGDHLYVKVVDNGPGIPDQEREVLTAGKETHLEHGSGLGLWLVAWIVSLSSGDLVFSENDPRGTVVTLSLPATNTE